MALALFFSGLTPIFSGASSVFSGRKMVFSGALVERSGEKRDGSGAFGYVSGATEDFSGGKWIVAELQVTFEEKNGLQRSLRWLQRRYWCGFRKFFALSV